MTDMYHRQILERDGLCEIQGMSLAITRKIWFCVELCQIAHYLGHNMFLIAGIMKCTQTLLLLKVKWHNGLDTSH